LVLLVSLLFLLYSQGRHRRSGRSGHGRTTDHFFCCACKLKPAMRTIYSETVTLLRILLVIPATNNEDILSSA